MLTVGYALRIYARSTHVWDPATANAVRLVVVTLSVGYTHGWGTVIATRFMWMLLVCRGVFYEDCKRAVEFFTDFFPFCFSPWMFQDGRRPVSPTAVA